MRQVVIALFSLVPTIAHAGECKRLPGSGDPLLKCTGDDGSEWACRPIGQGYMCLDFVTGAEWSTDCPECEGGRPAPGGGSSTDTADPSFKCDNACSGECACGTCPPGEICRRMGYTFCKCAPPPKAPKPNS